MSETTSQYGVQVEGFVRPRLPEIRAAIYADIQARARKNIRIGPKSLVGIMIDVFSERMAEMWEIDEAVYLSAYPGSASGASLDNSLTYTRGRRYIDARSEIAMLLFGTPGTRVDAGAVVVNTQTQDAFISATDVVISNANAGLVSINVPSALNSTTYTVSINGYAYNYTSDTSASTSEVVAGLVQALLSTGMAVSSDGANVNVFDVTMAGFVCTVSPNLQIITTASPVDFYADQFGEVAVLGSMPVRAITQVSGWNGVTAPVSGIVGREAERDDQVLDRYNTTVFRTGGGTVKAIKAHLLETVAGITYLEVYENRASTAVDGRPANSIEVVVEGGSNADLGAALLDATAAGTPMFGSTVIQVEDSTGTTQNLALNRVQPVYIWIKASISSYPEEKVAGNAAELASNKASEEGNKLAPGRDVIPQRLYGPIYGSTTGLDTITLSMASSTNPAFVPAPSDYKTSRVPISPRQRARFDPSRNNFVVT